MSRKRKKISRLQRKQRITRRLYSYLSEIIEYAQQINPVEVESLSGNLGEVKNAIDNIITEIKQAKSYISGATTLLLVKAKIPCQDINKHTAKLGGISYRSIDTKITIPLLKRIAPNYVNSSTAWLTPAFREQKDLSEAIKEKTKSKNVKDSFLVLLEHVNKNRFLAKQALLYLIFKLLETKKHYDEISTQYGYRIIREQRSLLTINRTIWLLDTFMSMSQKEGLYTSRIPVLIMYAIYKILTLRQIGIYKDKKLGQLKHHNISDSKEGYGDIEVYNENGDIFEVIEIKHKIPITYDMVKTKIDQLENTSVKRVLFLTTAEPYIREDDESEIVNFIEETKRSKDIEVICNGVLHTVKYYLRIIGDTGEFIRMFVTLLNQEHKIDASMITPRHLEIMENIMQNNL